MNTMFCPNCEVDRPARREVLEHEYDVRGQSVGLRLPMNLCEVCGEGVIDESYGDPTIRAYDEFRRRNHYLFPDEIRAIRKGYGLSQKSFAKLLDMSEATLNRYEGGSLQDGLHENAIRLAAGRAGMADLLHRRSHLIPESHRAAARAAVDRAAPADPPAEDRFESPVGEFTGFRPFQPKLFAAIVLFFCARLNGVFETKVNKLLFYADFEHYRLRGTSLTGSTYRKLQFGPVPIDYGGRYQSLVMNDYLDAEEVLFASGAAGLRYKAGPRASELEGVVADLPPEASRVLDAVLKRFGAMSAKRISDVSHEERAWIDTPDKRPISYRMACDLTPTLDL